MNLHISEEREFHPPERNAGMWRTSRARSKTFLVRGEEDKSLVFSEPIYQRPRGRKLGSYDEVVGVAERERTVRFLPFLLRDGRGVRRVKQSLKKNVPPCGKTR